MKYKNKFPELAPKALNRRAFLYGAGSVAIGLPFLESLQSRSAWAQDATPIFSLWVGCANGVVGDSWWPAATGDLSGLASETDRATSILGDYWDRLLLVRGVNFPGNNYSCGHAIGSCMVLTGAAPSGNGNSATSAGPSADTVVAGEVNPGGTDPLALYSGLKEGYINERLSFRSAGQVRSAEGNPYQAFQDLLRVAEPVEGGATTPAPAPEPETVATVDEITLRRKSVVDLVREELTTLQQRAGLSQADRDRLDQHITSLRQVEVDMTTMMVEAAPIAGCDTALVDVAGLEAAQMTFRSNGMIEPVAKLQFDLAAFAFACNVNRVASLQIGDGTDHTVYDVPSNGRNWNFHHISHRTQSDSAAGGDQTAEQSHIEIDRVRMETFKYALDKWNQAGLFDHSFIYYTNHINDGPSHSFSNLPIIIAGNAGGQLLQGQYIDAEKITNNRLLLSLMNVAGSAATSFGSGGDSRYEGVLA
jgi:hypothetical protein